MGAHGAFEAPQGKIQDWYSKMKISVFAGNQIRFQWRDDGHASLTFAPGTRHPEYIPEFARNLDWFLVFFWRIPDFVPEFVPDFRSGLTCIEFLHRKANPKSDYRFLPGSWRGNSGTGFGSEIWKTAERKKKKRKEKRSKSCYFFPFRRGSLILRGCYFLHSQKFQEEKFCIVLAKEYKPLEERNSPPDSRYCPSPAPSWFVSSCVGFRKKSWARCIGPLSFPPW